MSICVFGASTTWGAWDVEKGGWANRLRFFLDDNNYDILLYNLGVSGDTTDDILKRFDIEASARRPQIIIFSIGDNDSSFRNALQANKVLLGDFTKNITQLIVQSKKFNDKILFLGFRKVDETKTTPVEWNADAYYKNKYIELYDNELIKVCEENFVKYLSLINIIQSDDLCDGLHLNEVGHEKIFLEVKNFLLKNKWI